MNESNAQFRSVLRGYDTAQVDQHVRDLTQAAVAARREAGELSIQVSKLEAAQRRLTADVEAHALRTRALEDEQKKAAAPTYVDLGQRIGSILTLADEEGNELRALARADAQAHHALADESARVTRVAADTYAKETRSAADAEAARVLEDARRRADSILDDADRQATARREEAEAVYERARAKSAAAAADFETTLAIRRDTSAQEFAAEIAAAEQQLAAVQARAEQTRSDSELRAHEAATKSAHQLEEAKTQAQTMVAEAKIKAERIRADSERVLAAATQRRDSINAQLTNVRQMLTTLSGGAMVNPSGPAKPDEAKSDEAGSEQAGSEPAGSEPAGSEPAGSEPAEPTSDQTDAMVEAEHQEVLTDTQEGADEAKVDEQGVDEVSDEGSDEHADDQEVAPHQAAGVKG